MTTLTAAEARDLNTINEAARITYEAKRRIELIEMELGAIPLPETVQSIHRWAIGDPNAAASHGKHVRLAINSLLARMEEARKILDTINKSMNNAVTASDDARARRASAGPTLHV
jgi:hypothetical protein